MKGWRRGRRGGACWIPDLFTNRQGKTKDNPREFWLTLAICLPIIPATLFAILTQGW